MWGLGTNHPISNPETVSDPSHNSLFKAVGSREDPDVCHQGSAADVDPLPPHTGLPRPLARPRVALLRLRGARATLPTGCREGVGQANSRPLSCPHPGSDLDLSRRTQAYPLSPELTTLSCLKTWEERDTSETLGSLTCLAQPWWREQIVRRGL